MRELERNYEAERYSDIEEEEERSWDSFRTIYEEVKGREGEGEIWRKRGKKGARKQSTNKSKDRKPFGK